MNKGIVSLIRIYTEKGRPGEQKENAILVKDRGIAGDRYADGSDRQISICLLEVRNWMKAQEEPGLCFARYKENILLSGIPDSLLQTGNRMQIGDTLLEITSAQKKCFSECPYVSEGRACRLSAGACYARVLRSGEIKIGDEVICSPKMEY